MRTLYLLAIALLLGVPSMTGCGDEGPVVADINPSQIRYDVAGYRAVEFRLMDGTRCVTYVETVTCEWRTPVVLVPRVQ